MAVPSNKSPIATRPAPNSRNSKIADLLRREASPETRSPSLQSSPFKINASPRKKILSERNEPGRTSSMSEFKVKSVSFALAPMEDFDQYKEVAPTTTSEMVSKPLKPKIGVEAMVPPECPELVCEKASDCVNLDSSLEISPPPAAAEASFPVSSGGQVIARLDADPYAPPPYDPKTNYLSPRPQFLHYMPNPKVEYFMSKDGEGKRLEKGDERNDRERKVGSHGWLG